VVHFGGVTAVDATRDRSGSVRGSRRREQILEAAARLIAERGYHAVGMADIGEAAGIVGSGVYRHFESKVAVLAALLERAMLGLSERTPALLAAEASDAAKLGALIADHVAFVLDELTLIQLWHREMAVLPEPEQRRLRRLQRLYVEEWVRLLARLRPDLSEGAARLVVHAAIGAIQSVTSYRSGLPRAQLARLLERTAHDCLAIAQEGR
jgi:AcrR family transcriptional regulator